MSIQYRIQYRIVEGAKVYSGTRIIEVPLDRYMDIIHKNYSEASTVYLELIEEIEVDDTLTSTASDSIIILGCIYDSFLP